MTYANIILKQDNDDGNGNKLASRIEPALALLVEPLALKYPNWEFKETQTDYTYKTETLTGKHSKTDFVAKVFKVYDKREELGSVWIEKKWRTGEANYCVENFRISDMRERGSAMRSIHVKKAMRHIDKYFGRKNLDETLKDCIENAQNAIYQVHRDLSHKEQVSWNQVTRDAKQFLLDKYWEEFSLYANNKQAVEQYPTQCAESMAGAKIYEAVNQTKDYYLVNIDGLRYAIYRANEPIQIKESEELPAFIKRGVGMLKLLEDKQIIGDVGMRVDASTFVVLPQQI